MVFTRNRTCTTLGKITEQSELTIVKMPLYKHIVQVLHDRNMVKLVNVSTHLKLQVVTELLDS